MDVYEALNAFEEILLGELDQLHDLPNRLRQAEFKEVSRKSPDIAEDEQPVTLVLHKSANAPFAFSYILSDTNAVSDVALLFPNLSGAYDEVLNFVQQQENLIKTTSEVSQYLDLAPDYLRDTFARSRFWTAKAVGQTGMNLSLGPALWSPFEGEEAMALTVSPNEALKDPLDGSAIIKLTGPGSRLHKFVHVFSDIALRACPDLTKIVDVAQDHGFAVDEMDTETRKSMGMGPNSLFLCGGKGANPRSEDITSSIQVNCGSDFHFEFALEFILDPSLTPEVIQNALFSHLEIADTARSEGVALLDLHGQTYTVRHYVHHAAFGNHYFLLQK